MFSWINRTFPTVSMAYFVIVLYIAAWIYPEVRWKAIQLVSPYESDIVYWSNIVIAIIVAYMIFAVFGIVDGWSYYFHNYVWKGAVRLFTIFAALFFVRIDEPWNFWLKNIPRRAEQAWLIAKPYLISVGKWLLDGLVLWLKIVEWLLIAGGVLVILTWIILITMGMIRGHDYKETVENWSKRVLNLVKKVRENLEKVHIKNKRRQRTKETGTNTQETNEKPQERINA